MAKDYKKAIGVFAFIPPTNVVCDGDACIIAGSEAAMNEYIQVSSPSQSNKIIVKKTVFGEIMLGLSLGAAYAFDQVSYERFAPLAEKAGFKVPSFAFDHSSSEKIQFVHVRR